MHAAVSAKQGPGGTGELNERSVLENVPPWGPGSNRPLWEWGAETLLTPLEGQAQGDLVPVPLTTCSDQQESDPPRGATLPEGLPASGPACTHCSA